MKKSTILAVFVACCLVAVSILTTQRVFAQSTQNGSVGVEGRVQGDPPSTAATITTPSNGQTFTNTPITVAGLCPRDTIVKIFKNGVFAGSVQCINGSFSLQVDLFSGRNDLVARVADALDQEGPDSATVSVTFNDARFGGASSNRISLTSNYVKRGSNPGETLTWPVILTGGTPPYAITVDWGDGKPNTLISREFAGVIDLTHVYDNPGTYNIIIKATDKNGDAAFLQVVAVANGAIVGKNPAKVNDAGAAAQIRLVGLPAYPVMGGLFLLAVLSFWLGGRYALLNLRKKLDRGQGSAY